MGPSIMIALCGKLLAKYCEVFYMEGFIQVEKVRMFQGSLQKKHTNQTPWSLAKKSFSCAKDDS